MIQESTRWSWSPSSQPASPRANRTLLLNCDDQGILVPLKILHASKRVTDAREIQFEEAE